MFYIYNDERRIGYQRCKGFFRSIEPDIHRVCLSYILMDWAQSKPFVVKSLHRFPLGYSMDCAMQVRAMRAIHTLSRHFAVEGIVPSFKKTLYLWRTFDSLMVQSAGARRSVISRAAFKICFIHFGAPST